MSTNWYGKAAQALAAKKIDLVNDTIKVMLVTSAYTPNMDNHGVKSDVTGEVSGSGYTSGGATLTGKTLTQETSPNTWKWDANDVTWANTSVTFRYAVIYDDTHVDKPLIGYVDFGSNKTATAQDLTIKWQFYDDETFEMFTGILEMGY